MKTNIPFLLLAIALCACQAETPPPPPYAVDVFAEDTVAAHVTVTVTGPMEVSLNGAGFYMRKDKSLVVLTPATLVVTGVGSAIIASLDSARRIAIVPAGTRPDSVDALALVGIAMKLSRVEAAAAVRLEVAKP